MADGARRRAESLGNLSGVGRLVLHNPNES